MGNNTSSIITSLNEHTFKELFDLYFNPICEFLNFYTKDNELIQDIVQDIFVKLWEERDNLKINHIKTYLYTSARNHILNQLRNEQNRLRLLESWAKQEFEQSKSTLCFDPLEFQENLQQAIDNLPEKYKKIYLQSRNEKLTYSQIALKESISVKTVESRIGEALKQIKHSLKKHYRTTLLFLNIY